MFPNPCLRGVLSLTEDTALRPQVGAGHRPRQPSPAAAAAGEAGEPAVAAESAAAGQAAGGPGRSVRHLLAAVRGGARVRGAGGGRRRGGGRAGAAALRPAAGAHALRHQPGRLLAAQQTDAALARHLGALHLVPLLHGRAAAQVSVDTPRPRAYRLPLRGVWPAG